MVCQSVQNRHQMVLGRRQRHHSKAQQHLFARNMSKLAKAVLHEGNLATALLHVHKPAAARWQMHRVKSVYDCIRLRRIV